MSHVFVTRAEPLGKIAGRGRPRGTGENARLLYRMKPGEQVFDVPRKKKDSILVTARRHNIKVSVRYMPETKLFAIFKREQS